MEPKQQPKRSPRWSPSRRSGTAAAPWRATPEGRDAVSRCRVELMVAALARGAKTFEAREDALATLASFLGDDAFFFTPTRTCLVADGWDEADGWDDADGWGDDASASHPSRDAEETLFPKRFSEEKQKRVPEVTSSAGKETSFPFRPEDAARVVAAAFAGGTDDDDEAAYEQTVFAAKVALLFPFPDLHEETLARLAAIRETERATERSAFSHKKRNLLSFRDPDPAFAALAAARLPSLLSSDSRAGPSTPRAKSARDLAVETVLARFAFAFRRRARDEGDWSRATTTRSPRSRRARPPPRAQVRRRRARFGGAFADARVARDGGGCRAGARAEVPRLETKSF